MTPATLIRRVRLVDLSGDGSPATGSGEVDVAIARGRITAVAPRLQPAGDQAVIDGEGRWALPGLWDAHVHLGQWSLGRSRVDVSSADSAPAAAALMAAALGRPGVSDLVVGAGYRSPTWPEPPTVDALDRATGQRPVVLISGDCHNGWLNSAALARFGLAPRAGVLLEAEWFAVLADVVAAELAQAGPRSYAAAQQEAARRGVVGVIDYEFEPGFRRWPERYAATGLLRVQTSVYPDDLDEAIASGVRSGDVLAGRDGVPMLTMGSLKIISDGSLNTRTARCVEPYPNADGLAEAHGVQNYDLDALTQLLAQARAHGLTAAVHAIGDAAVSTALDAFEATGATGSLEHAQLMATADVSRLARLGLTASVQPAHLLDDRAVTHQLWPDRADRCFPFASLAAAGVRLAFGSDAPVAPLDPWLAIAAAVHRGDPDDAPWNPAQALSPVQALAASVRGRIAPGEPGDLVLLDDDPLCPDFSSAEAARRLRRMDVGATVIGGVPA